MHTKFLVWSVVDSDHRNLWIIKDEFVIVGKNLSWVLSSTFRRQQSQDRKTETQLDPGHS